MFTFIKAAGLIWFGVLLPFYCFGQSNWNGIPLGAMPMQYNTSFAGETGAPRFSSSSTYGIQRTLILNLTFMAFPFIMLMTSLHRD